MDYISGHHKFRNVNILHLNQEKLNCIDECTCHAIAFEELP